MWLRPQGYSFIVSPVAHRAQVDFHSEWVSEGTTEFDTATCNHCNCIYHIKHGCPPEEMGGFCRQCMKVICPRCVGKPCVPWLKKMDEMEQKDYMRRQYEVMISR